MNLQNRYFPTFVHEKNLKIKNGTHKFGLLFPGKYTIGMSGMTVLLLKEIVESVTNWSFERYFLPWNPYATPKSLEHQMPIENLDVVGFTAQFEIDYLTVTWLLNKAHIPLSNLQRREKSPPVVVGGPCVGANPFPLLDLVDGIFLGDAENSLPKFLELIEAHGNQSVWEHPELYQEIKGYWSPHFHEIPAESTYSSFFQRHNFEDITGKWRNKFDFINLNDSIYPLKQIYTDLPQYHPYAPIKGQAFQLELGRGCNHRCKFCMVGSGMNPARYRSYSRLLELATEGIQASNTTTIDIFGTNLSDFPKLNDLIWEFINQDLKISIATLRPDKVASEVVQAIHKGEQKSLTITPEAGSDRLRFAIGKKITTEQILYATQLIFENGLEGIKDFFLTGLPGEKEEDREAAFALVQQQVKIAKNANIIDPVIKVDVNPLVPKWQTPYKNWVIHYLPENRSKLQKTINHYYTTLHKIKYVYPKQTFVMEFLGQTWLTQLQQPINKYAVNLPSSHIPLSKNAAFYLLQFEDEFNKLLHNIWNKHSPNKVTHSIHATKYSDESFSMLLK